MEIKHWFKKMSSSAASCRWNFAKRHQPAKNSLVVAFLAVCELDIFFIDMDFYNHLLLSLFPVCQSSSMLVRCSLCKTHCINNCHNLIADTIFCFEIFCFDIIQFFISDSLQFDLLHTNLTLLDGCFNNSHMMKQIFQNAKFYAVLYTFIPSPPFLHFFLFSCRSQMTSKSGDNQKVAIKTCASMSPMFLPHLISFIIYYNCTGLKHLRFYLFYMITKHMLLLAKSSRDLITEELTNYKCFQLHINFKTLIDKPIWLFLLK